MSTLNPDEIASLMQAIEDGQLAQSEPAPGAPSGPVAVCDLTNPERNVPEPMPALDGVHETIARSLASALAGRTRKRMVIRPGAPGRMRLEDMRPLMTPPTVLAVMELRAGADTALLLIDRELAEALVLAGLGAPDASPDDAMSEDVGLTSLERVVLRRLLSLSCKGVREGFAPIISLQPKVTRIETDPRMATAASGRDIFILTSFEVSGEVEGRFSFAIPFSVIEASRENLSPRRPQPIASDNPEFQKSLRRHLKKTELDISVELGRTPMTYEKLQALQEGDVLLLGTDENDALPVTVGDRVRLLAEPTSRGGHLAVRVQELLTDPPEEAESPPAFLPAPPSRPRLGAPRSSRDQERSL